MKILLTVLVFFLSLSLAGYQKVPAAPPPLTKVIMTSGSASKRDGVVYVAALEILSLQCPQAKQTDPSLLIDPSSVKPIDQSGLIRSLYNK